jgi:hypothetical protein
VGARVHVVLLAVAPVMLFLAQIFHQNCHLFGRYLFSCKRGLIGVAKKRNRMGLLCSLFLSFFFCDRIWLQSSYPSLLLSLLEPSKCVLLLVGVLGELWDFDRIEVTFCFPPHALYAHVWLTACTADMADGESHDDHDRSVEIWKIKKLIRSLEAARGCVSGLLLGFAVPSPSRA